ncbi:MAG: AAA family ATPase [Rubellimicrobium sp.]|nr:AAA family ATPase [Rubellimicrobium sp.]
MRLRAIELTNVRRFAGRRARLHGIGDGITVLSEPNEFGKSTFFDALHALFFERHNSRNAAIRSLQPHAGGAPEVTVEVDLPDGRFRIAKRWLNRPQAQVHDASGRLIAQADEAEAWIDRLTGDGLAGPSGLLWVRQGLVGLEPEGSGTDDRRERERGLSTRRDLLSSVAGEIDMMTGGRRMDAVLDRVGTALAQLATATGRAKAGGEWARALDEAEALAKKEADLRPRAAHLSADLARRAEVQRLLARLDDPADAATRARTLTEAEAGHRAALDHQHRIEQAGVAHRLAVLDAARDEDEIARLTALAARLEQARADLARAEAAAAAARARTDDLGQRDRDAAAAQDRAAAAGRALRLRLDRAIRARAAIAARAQAADLHRRVERAGTFQAALDQARGLRARITASAGALATVEKAQTALDLARARAEAQAVTIEAHPDGPAASIAGTPLPAGPQPILGPTELTLPGFGALRIDPGTRPDQGGDGLARLARALEAALTACSAADLPAARAAWAEAQRLDHDIARTTALLAEVAPDGIEALRSAFARATADAAETPDDATPPEDPEALTAALARADEAEAGARAAATAAHGLAVQAAERRAEAEADRSGAARHLAATLAEAGDDDRLTAAIAAASARLPALIAARDSAARTLAALDAGAPDPATAAARLERARSAVEPAARDAPAAREELAALNATINALADEGIEEHLTALAGARHEATARAARYEAEVRALTRLQRALEEARTSARDAYFGPVLRELQPLLSILHPGAQLGIDDTSLLPATLTRNGQQESLDILSGGTREQVAILTRLAFARLFAAAGRPVPVILDDALVHSDDDRIEAMFDALHRTARDQQILVFTCRQRAFAALGGARAGVTVEDT